MRIAAAEPREVHPLWVAAFNAGDLDRLMEFFEPEACFVSKSGRVAAGAAAVRDAYRRTLANKPHMELEVRKVLPAGPGLALVIVPFTQKAVTADGEAKVWTGIATDIVRQQSDGTWRLVLDNPFGIE